ncbi:MAG: HEAT repeat domain-containing protein [Gemmatimonadaceae bacterium]
MTDQAATPPAVGTGGPAEEQELPFPPAPIEEMLRLFVKAGRAHQLYLPNNPVYKGAIDAVRAAFAPIWRETDEFAVTFTENEIRWHGRPVLTEPSKAADSLPWTFFKDGVREVTFTLGFEQDELVRLFDILQRVRKALPDEDDLLTLLWQADFTNLRYRYVDLGAEPSASLDEGAGSVAGTSPDGVRAAAQEPAAESNAVVNMQDFDATLYFLDEKELDYLKEEIEREYQGDLRQNVTAMLFDIYEAQSVPAVRDEVSEIIEQLMLQFLAGGELRTVASLLAESQVVVRRAVDITPEQIERMGRLPERLSAPEPLGQLLQALDEAADLPPQNELTELFEQLRPAALGTIFARLSRLQNENIRGLVAQAAERLASANTGELIALIGSTDRTVAGEAVRRAGAMRAAAAVAPMARVLVDGDVELRQLAVHALTTIGSAGALQALERCIEDDDREVRVAAVRTLGGKAYKGVAQRVEAVVKGRALRGADLTERMAFFEAHGALCGDGGVPHLDGILNSKGMFGKREDPELRACAAIALGRVGTQSARASLQRATAEKDVVVRNAVNRALRGVTGGGGGSA